METWLIQGYTCDLSHALTRVYKHPSTCADIHTQVLALTANQTHPPDTMCHRSSYYGGLGCGYGSFGSLGFGRGCGCGSFRTLGFGSGFGGYGCGSGFGSFGYGYNHCPSFFGRYGFSTFYWNSTSTSEVIGDFPNLISKVRWQRSFWSYLHRSI